MSIIGSCQMADTRPAAPLLTLSLVRLSAALAAEGEGAPRESRNPQAEPAGAGDRARLTAREKVGPRSAAQICPCSSLQRPEIQLLVNVLPSEIQDSDRERVA